MKKILIILFLVIIIPLVIFALKPKKEPTKPKLWSFQSIDTMKYSRDLAREKINDRKFDEVIKLQTEQVAKTGATHIAIATPYDEEFYPFLERWVLSARDHNLKVWFRGNFSGWEGWFEYDKIDRAEHLRLTKSFISNHRELFQDGDVFTACPECENGGPGDPRSNGDPEGHRDFLISEYLASKEEFEKLGKDVEVNYFSMNADVAKLIMDEDTAKSLGNRITIDHYVKNPEDLAQDVVIFGKNGTNEVILGEYGVYIPDIHGRITDDEQARWLEEALTLLVEKSDLTGLSYWTNVGGSTELWDSSGAPSKKVKVLNKFYNPEHIRIYIKNEAGSLIDAQVITLNRLYVQNANGIFVPKVLDDQRVKISHKDYQELEFDMNNLADKSIIIMKKNNENFIFKIRKFIYSIISSIL